MIPEVGTSHRCPSPITFICVFFFFCQQAEFYSDFLVRKLPNASYVRLHGVPNDEYVGRKNGIIPNANPIGPKVFWVPKIAY